MKKFTVQVTQTVEIEIDETKMDDKFMLDFRQAFYPFYTVEQHVEHLGQLACRGLTDGFSKFIEGYGPPADLGIKIGDPHANHIETEIVSTTTF